MCFVWIWEQTAIISLYSINWLVFITETVCVYCAVRTECLYMMLYNWLSKAQWSLYVPPIGHYMYHQFNIQQFHVLPHSVLICFVWIWEQTSIISLYKINWLVFRTETKCVYCAVRTGYINSTVTFVTVHVSLIMFLFYIIFVRNPWLECTLGTS
jgi:hypothetical protein